MLCQGVVRVLCQGVVRVLQKTAFLSVLSASEKMGEK